MRSKEDAHDYRYFPEPDLAPIVLSEEYIENIRKSLPEMPHIKKERYMRDLGLSEYDAEQIISSKETALYFEEASNICKNPKLLQTG